LLEEPFSSKNGLLTSSLKMKRLEIKMKYKNELDNLYLMHSNLFNSKEAKTLGI
jgi:long-subunit acyl-CoA synthetase (AMP-forming)